MKALKFKPIMFAGMAVLVLSAFKAENNGTSEAFEFRSVSNEAFTTGETLKYRIHYGLINAGSMEYSVDNNFHKINKRSTYKITAKGRSYSSFDWFFKVRDEFVSFVDSASLAPLQYSKNQQEGSYSSTDFAIYKHEIKKIYTKKKSIEMEEYTQDVISAVYYARNLDLQNATVGQEFPIDIYLDQEIYHLKFKFLGRETIKTDIGKVKALKISPLLVADRVFGDEDGMTIWVSDDANKIPLKIKSELAVGSVKADITEYSGLKNPFSSLKD